MSDTIEVIILAKDQVTKTVGGIRSALGGLGSSFAPIKAVGTAAFLGIGAAAVGGFGMALNSAIGMNASLEQSTMQFTTLMGDADLAAEHVANLFEFGAKTPFETGPIIQASKHFQIFGGAALNTMENLTLVGDAAAAVGAPIDEVGFWVGRLYSNLQGGQPFGEAAMRLQELGIMTPQVRTELEGLQEAGKSGTEIFGVFQGALGSFTGAMEMQSQSWTGLVSTIKDQFSLMMADALRPFFDLAKEGLSSLAAWLASPEIQAGIQNIATGFANLIQSITAFVTGSVIPFVQQHGPAIKAALIAIGVALGGLLIVGAISAAITVALNPIVLIMVAIGAAAALLKTAWDSNWGGIQEKTAAVMNFIRPLIEGAMAFIRGVVETALGAIQAFWAAHGEAIVAVATQAWNLIKGLIDGVVKQIQLIIQAFRLAMEGDWEGLGKKIFEIWENAWTTVVNFLKGLWDMIVPLLVSLWNSIKNWFTSTDWASLGRSIIQGIINGVRAMGDALSGVLQGIVESAIARIKQILGIASPSRVFFEIGIDLAQGLVDGIRAKFPDALAVMEELFKVINSASTAAGNFGNIFSAQSISPIQEGIAAITDQIDGYTAALESMAGTLGLDLNDANTLLRLQQIAANPLASSSERDTATVALAFLQERQSLTLEQIALQRQLEEQQARMLRLEMQRQQLGFLQEQFNLLKLINENGLDPHLLDGLTLGPNADPGALMDVMIAAMNQLLSETAGELTGALPPVARSLPEQFFKGAAGPGGGGSVVVNIDARGAAKGVEKDLRAMVVDVMREYGVKADIRLRTA